MACIVSILPSFVGLLIVASLSTDGLMHSVLGALVASLAGWAFRLSPGTLLLAWMLATAVGALVGGFIGSFLGNCCAALVLKRVSDGHDLNQ